MGRILIIWCLVGGLAATVRAEAPETVGRLGSPEQIVFVGNTSFTAEELRKGLSWSYEFVIAGHPDGLLIDYLKSLEQQLQRGYRERGFAEASAIARHDSGSDFIHVAITEGPRYLKGKIEVHGAKTLREDHLKEILTAKLAEIPTWSSVTEIPLPPRLAITRAKHFQPVWTRSEPAFFVDDGVIADNSSLARAFLELGYPKAQWDGSTDPLPDGTATLRINVTEEGQQSRIHAVTVSGTEINTEDAVRKLLEVGPDEPFTPRLEQQIHERLWHSARFRAYEAKFVLQPDLPADTAGTLQIAVAEVGGLPPLDSPLSPDEELLLKVAQWFESLGRDDNDVVIEFDSAASDIHAGELQIPESIARVSLQLLISDRDRAVLATFTARDESGQEQYAGSVEIGPERTNIRMLGSGELLELATPVNLGSYFHVHVSTVPPNDNDHHTKISFGSGTSGVGDPSDHPLAISVIASPAWLLQEYHRKKWSISTKEGLARIVEPEEFDCLCEVATGRLLELKSHDTTVGVSIRTKRGAFREAIEQQNRLIDETRKTLLNDSPITSLLGLAVRQLPDARPSTKLIQSTFKRGGFRDFDNLFQTLMDLYSPPEFSIRSATRDAPTSYYGQIRMADYVLKRTLPADPDLPVITSELFRAATPEIYRESPSWKKLATENRRGPLGNLIYCYSFGVAAKPIATHFGFAGLKVTNRDGLDRDCQMFLNHDWPLGHLLLTATEVLQSYEPDQLAALADELPVDAYDRRQWKKVFATFHTHKDLPPEEALRKALHVAWAPLIEWRLEGLLTSLTR